MTISSIPLGGSGDRTGDGIYIADCPECGGQLRQKNLRRRMVGRSEECANCSDWESREFPEPGVYPGDDIPNVVDELGCCGCGDPAIVDATMRKYLDGVRRHWDEWHAWDKAHPGHWATSERLNFRHMTQWPYGFGESECYLLAYLADHLGWTTHGGSVVGAWLTDDGREALDELDSRHETEEP